MLILLDFDGTLADSSTGIYLAFSKACKKVGAKTPDINLFCRNIGPPIQYIAAKLIPDIESGTLEEIRSTFRTEYDNKYCTMVRWYEGVVDELRLLASCRDVRLTIVTNKPTQPTISIITAAGLESLFDYVIGIDYRNHHGIGPTFDSKSEAIGFAMSLANCTHQHAVYVGDTPSDRKACHQQGIRFIAATYGFYEWQTSELEATAEISSFSGLSDFLGLHKCA